MYIFWRCSNIFSEQKTWHTKFCRKMIQILKWFLQCAWTESLESYIVSLYTVYLVIWLSVSNTVWIQHLNWFKYWDIAVRYHLGATKGGHLGGIFFCYNFKIMVPIKYIWHLGFKCSIEETSLFDDFAVKSSLSERWAEGRHLSAEQCSGSCREDRRSFFSFWYVAILFFNVFFHKVYGWFELTLSGIRVMLQSVQE